MKSDAKPIEDFNGYFSFLNNDYSAWVHYQARLYPSVAVAFQAARTNDDGLRLRLSQIEDYQEFARLAQSISNPQGWANKRIHIMELLVRDKFKRNKDISLKLQATNQRPLINGFSQGGNLQCYWGVVKGNGSNQLGKILMKIRSQINANTDSIKWLQDQNVENDRDLFPKVSLVVMKDNQTIDKIYLQKKNIFIFGALPKSDFKLDHQSISKSHAAIYFSTSLQVMVVDLCSTHGTKILCDSEAHCLDPLIPRPLKSSHTICFGLSSRRYIVQIDLEDASKHLANRQARLELSISQAQLLRHPEHSQEQMRSLIGLSPNNCLFLQAADHSLNYHSLKQIASQIGNIKTFKMLLNQHSGKFQGNVLISYEEPIQQEQINIIWKAERFQWKIIDQVQAKRMMEQYSLENVKEKRRQQDKKHKRERSKDRKKREQRSVSRSRSRDRKHKKR